MNSPMNTTMINPISTVQPIYEADTSVVHAIHHCKQHLHMICRQHMHRRVRIITTTGEHHEGMLVGFDEHHLFLEVSSPSSCPTCMGPSTRQPFPYGGAVPFYNPYANVILPLVLFNLLTISLL
jgi:hypothetical protein